MPVVPALDVEVKLLLEVSAEVHSLYELHEQSGLPSHLRRRGQRVQRVVQTAAHVEHGVQQHRITVTRGAVEPADYRLTVKI